MIRPRGALLGLRAALAAPRWMGRRGLNELLAVPEVRPAAGTDTASALRTCRFALRVLARLRFVGGPWRDSCLYQSVAACLALRGCGVRAVLRLGARSAPGSISAHAWVEDADGRTLVLTPQGHTPFQPAG